MMQRSKSKTKKLSASDSSSNKKVQQQRPQRHDIGVQVDLPGRSGRSGSCGCWLLATLAVLVGILVASPLGGLAMMHVEQLLLGTKFVVDSEMMEDLGMPGIVLFKQHDRDGDNVLTLEEFEPIAHRLLQLNESTQYDLPIEEWDEVITLQAKFQPLKVETMSKSSEDSGFSLDSLHGLKYWTNPAKEWQNFAAGHLTAFMPEDPYLLESCGEPYFLISPLNSMQDGATLSSNRYLPPPLTRAPEIAIHQVLTIFHPRPFVYSRFSPQGSVAVVRATNDKYVDIMFRIHAEFQLNDAPFYPFWYTPAQFTGHLIMSKDGGKVLYFHLYVPNDKRLNVDMEWLNGPKEQENMEVDIGYMPEMEVKSTRSSVQVMFGGVDTREKFIEPSEDYQQSLDSIQWKEEISERKAARLLEIELYPFKKVEYYNFTQAYTVAALKKKPVHSILLWGALDDQSC